MSASGNATISVCVLCSTAIGAKSLYRGLFEYLAAKGFKITLIVGEQYEPPAHLADVLEVIVVPMERAPAPLKDLRSLARLIAIFRERKFDAFHLSTPKASLLGALALRLLGRTNSLYVVRGRPYENLTGIKRRFFSTLESFVCDTARFVVPISRHLESALVSERICKASKIRFLSKGSSNGIDTAHFEKTPAVSARAASLRERLGLKETDIVALILGRVSHDKGIHFGLEAFDIASVSNPNLKLVVAGPDDPREPPSEAVLNRLKSDPRIVRVGWVDDTPAFYALCDVFLFPTLREGFGNVALEAAALGAPVIAFAAQGPKEAISDGETGFLSKPFDVKELGDRLGQLASDAGLRRRMGAAGRQWVQAHFRSEVIWREIESAIRDVAQR